MVDKEVEKLSWGWLQLLSVETTTLMLLLINMTKKKCRLNVAPFCYPHTFPRPALTPLPAGTDVLGSFGLNLPVWKVKAAGSAHHQHVHIAARRAAAGAVV